MPPPGISEASDLLGHWPVEASVGSAQISGPVRVGQYPDQRNKGAKGEEWRVAGSASEIKQRNGKMERERPNRNKPSINDR